MLLGFVAAGFVIAALIFVAESDRLLAAITNVDPVLYATGFLATSISYLFRGYVWVRLLRITGVTLPRSRVLALFLMALFIRYLTPYGQVTTEPLVAYIVAQDGRLPFEDGFAGVLTADYLNYIPYYTLGFGGFIVIVLGGRVNPGITEYLGGIVGLVGVLIILTGIILYRRSLVEHAAHGGAWALRRTIGRLSARIRRLCARDHVTERLGGFYGTIDLIRANPRAVVIAAVSAHVGMVFLMLPVYTTARAVGIPLSFAVVAFVVMISKLGALFPGPGGLGGIEATIVGAFVIVVDLPLAAALGITLLYRLCTYWYTVAIGGSIALVYSVRTAPGESSV